MSGPNKGEPEALVAFEQLPRLDPCDAKGCLGQGDILFALARSEEALVRLGGAYDTFPKPAAQ